MKKRVSLSLLELLGFVTLVAAGLGAMMNASQPWMLLLVQWLQLLVFLAMAACCFHQRRSTRIFAACFLLATVGISFAGRLDEPLQHSVNHLYSLLYRNHSDDAPWQSYPAPIYYPPATYTPRTIAPPLRPLGIPNGVEPYEPGNTVPSTLSGPSLDSSSRDVAEAVTRETITATMRASPIVSRHSFVA